MTKGTMVVFPSDTVSEEPVIVIDRGGGTVDVVSCLEVRVSSFARTMRTKKTGNRRET